MEGMRVVNYREDNALKVNVLGTVYTIKKGVTEEEDPILEGADGYIDSTTKEIKIVALEPDEKSVKDLSYYEKKVVRHELVHAFLYESGLACNSDWAENEELVDWLAIQFPKMSKMFNELEIM